MAQMKGYILIVISIIEHLQKIYSHVSFFANLWSFERLNRLEQFYDMGPTSAVSPHHLGVHDQGY